MKTYVILGTPGEEQWSASFKNALKVHFCVSCRQGQKGWVARLSFLSAGIWGNTQTNLHRSYMMGSRVLMLFDEMQEGVQQWCTHSGLRILTSTQISGHCKENMNHTRTPSSWLLHIRWGCFTRLLLLAEMSCRQGSPPPLMQLEDVLI